MAHAPFNGRYLNGIALFPKISTSNLHGNNLRLANYLNVNAPYPIVWQLALQPDVNHVLKMVAPTRNALSTFTAQVGQLAFCQSIADHFNKYRQIEPSESEAISMHSSMENGDLTASSTDTACQAVRRKCYKKTHSPWVALLGDFNRLDAQHQTPAFDSLSGGVIAAYDYCRKKRAKPPTLASPICAAILRKRKILAMPISIKDLHSSWRHSITIIGTSIYLQWLDIIDLKMSETSIFLDFQNKPDPNFMDGWRYLILNWVLTMRSFMNVGSK